MGFELGVVVAGPLAPERIVPVTRQLLARWPWLRLPLETAHARQVVLGSVERTSYMVGSYRHAQLLDEQIQRELVEASAALPDCSLAWVHTDCFGGQGVDDGLVARAGTRVCESSSLPELLAHVGIETTGFFAAFERGHFGVNVDPRMFDAWLARVLGEDSDDDPDARDDPRWLDRMLDELHGERSELERGVVAALDRRFDDAQALRVLADALALAGDARAEPLALALVGESSERALAASRTPLERQLAALAQAKPAHHLLIEDWWPRLWLSWSGPFVTRLVVRNAVKPMHHDTPYPTDFSRHDDTDARVRTLLGLPCARYLSGHRVSLLRCPQQRDLRGHDLSHFDLDGVDLSTARLAGACLQRTRLARSVLAHAELRDADLRDADLRGADLRMADLHGADLRGAMLRDSDLRFADLRNARLDGGALASARTEGLLR
jgi:hypothetical protein